MSINNFILVIIVNTPCVFLTAKDCFGFLQHIIPFSFNKAA
ncbi:hypothetical protein SFK1770_0879 [Shigella flexneri K-1770]|nr:hypothetical protein SFVA6_0869 [Shigella flexneri VA-6]EIQ18319.1 hypothetical protein SFK1770_0879 [Shigella flexneri K-1770]